MNTPTLFDPPNPEHFKDPGPKLSPVCALKGCEKEARNWSGAFLDDEGCWTGWCGNSCRNAWLKTPKGER